MGNEPSKVSEQQHDFVKGMFEERNQVGGMKFLGLKLSQDKKGEIFQKENQRDMEAIWPLAKTEAAMQGEPTVWSLVT